MVGVPTKDLVGYFEWPEHGSPRLKDIIETKPFYCFMTVPEWRPEVTKALLFVRAVDRSGLNFKI